MADFSSYEKLNLSSALRPLRPVELPLNKMVLNGRFSKSEFALTTQSGPWRFKLFVSRAVTRLTSNGFGRLVESTNRYCHKNSKIFFAVTAQNTWLFLFVKKGNRVGVAQLEHSKSATYTAG